jgi:hypothetical protein
MTARGDLVEALLLQGSAGEVADLLPKARTEAIDIKNRSPAPR